MTRGAVGGDAVRGGEPFVGTHLGAGGDGHAFILRSVSPQHGAPLVKPKTRCLRLSRAASLQSSRSFSPSNFVMGGAAVRSTRRLALAPALALLRCFALLVRFRGAVRRFSPKQVSPNKTLLKGDNKFHPTLWKSFTSIEVT